MTTTARIHREQSLQLNGKHNGNWTKQDNYLILSQRQWIKTFTRASATHRARINWIEICTKNNWISTHKCQSFMWMNDGTQWSWTKERTLDARRNVLNALILVFSDIQYREWMEKLNSLKFVSIYCCAWVFNFIDHVLVQAVTCLVARLHISINEYWCDYDSPFENQF